jgi:hypothetical protein
MRRVLAVGNIGAIIAAALADNLTDIRISYHDMVKPKPTGATRKRAKVKAARKQRKANK